MPVRVLVRYLCTDRCLGWGLTALRTAHRGARSKVVSFMLGGGWDLVDLVDSVW
jgi:hypothetical protein